MLLVTIWSTVENDNICSYANPGSVWRTCLILVDACVFKGYELLCLLLFTLHVWVRTCGNHFRCYGLLPLLYVDLRASISILPNSLQMFMVLYSFTIYAQAVYMIWIWQLNKYCYQDFSSSMGVFTIVFSNAYCENHCKNWKWGHHRRCELVENRLRNISSSFNSYSILWHLSETSDWFETEQSSGLRRCCRSMVETMLINHIRIAITNCRVGGGVNKITRQKETE